MSIESWNKRRAVTALIEIARDACQAAEAALNSTDAKSERELLDAIWQARRELHRALNIVAEVDWEATMRPVESLSKCDSSEGGSNG